MDSGSLAWVLTSAALVLFMTPGLAFFYGGMDREPERAQHADDELLLHADRARSCGWSSATRWRRCRSTTTSSATSTPLFLKDITDRR